MREWLSAFLVFVRLFDRAVGLVPQLEPRELERSLQLLGRIPDATILRLFDLLGGLDDGDVIDLVEALSRLSPTAARRATKLMSGVVDRLSLATERRRPPEPKVARRRTTRLYVEPDTWSGEGYAPLTEIGQFGQARRRTA